MRSWLAGLDLGAHAAEEVGYNVRYVDAFECGVQG
jgi:hypothetical protein